MTLIGIVENIIFRNAENGYTVLEIGAGGSLYTAVGIFPPVTEGENIEIEGQLIRNERYGDQIKVEKVRTAEPTDEESVLRYLASGLFKGVGEVTASAIVEAFGAKALSVIENEPSKLSEIRGVSLKKAMEINQSYLSHKAMQEVILYLQKYDISLNLAIKIFKAYGDAAIRSIEDNPYRLVDDIDGVGFLTADKIAAAMGIDRLSPFRVSAGIAYILGDTVAKNGHTHLPKDMLVAETLKLLGIDEENDGLVLECLEDMEITGKVVLLPKDEYTAVILSKFFIAETSIAARIAAMLEQGDTLSLDVENDIREYERINGITLHEGQKEAVRNCLVRCVNVITGGPGTGKTTIVKCIISILSSRGYSVSLCAPTGRAAKRLAEATGEPAKTIHRLLDLDYKNGKGYFTYSDSFRLESDVVIVDEVSMCDEYTFDSLVKAIKRGGRLVMVGDKDQLPSVGAGNVLADIINSGIVPVSYLTQIYRQDGESLIIENAHRINRGEMPVIDNGKKDFFFDNKSDPSEIIRTVVEMVTKRIPSFAKVSPRDIQVLCPMKKGLAGVENANAELQLALNSPSPSKAEIKVGSVTLREGDKVIHTVNNYKLDWTRYNDEDSIFESGSGVFNGDIGYINSIDKNSSAVTVDFDDGKRAVYKSEDLDEIIPAYAVSVHKSQGSEFEVVVLAITGGNYMIMTRNLLYTAVTRAKSMVVIVGSRESLRSMVRNNYTQKRYSMLTDFLIKEGERRGLL